MQILKNAALGQLLRRLHAIEQDLISITITNL